MFKSNQNPMFRNKFAEDIFNQKYRHEGALTWADLSKTLVEDVCRNKMTQEEKDRLVSYVTDLKFIPGGRYLYYAGRPKKFFNNCFTYDTTFVTDKGIKTLGECRGKEVGILSPVTEDFLKATVESFGEQDIYEYTFNNVRGKSKKEWKVRATENHRWILKDKSETTNLAVGDVVPASTGYADRLNTTAILHGMIFADGNVHPLKSGFGHQLRLCGRKREYLSWLDNQEISVTYPPFAKGDALVYVNSPVNFKELPKTTDVDYISSFLQGWVMLDGYSDKVNQLHSINREALEYFIENAVYLGVVVTGNIIECNTPTNYGKRTNTLYHINYQGAESFAGYKVTHKVLIGTQPVCCVVEPRYKQFTLGTGMTTGNCYLLRALEDTREDWADLSKRAETCLATGGGIGVDYSVYRASGAILHGTGGIASGPISKMLMINEIGRQIMQGGSRRSAIYASLNWQHKDVLKFLHAKNWNELPVGAQKKADGSIYSFADAKNEDFNFPCPLDMTNISVNYDTNWLVNYWETGKVGEVFHENVRQALSTAEPGFSFNFFDKEKETLRNACTEVTSEDDSDVCNLGSINLSRIDNLKEFSDIVNLSTKFLVCGTLVADLPYDKVKETREKNRRLGLGLMGMHEWLIQRGQKYEVTPALHRWLTVYRDVSKATANSFSDKLAISRPVGVRAIAPTGSIGILAGTTTGIEPLFAAAYKRRYLKGTKWHYQYVVDGTAQEFANRYGKDPDELETALSLATDYERRIKFQADVQDYVDMSISSTINLPKWGSEHNNENTVEKFANCLASYAHRLRGFTCYPDGARGGQPLTLVSYKEAVEKLGEVFEESVQMHDICDITGHGGSCGV